MVNLQPLGECQIGEVVFNDKSVKKHEILADRMFQNIDEEDELELDTIVFER